MRHAYAHNAVLTMEPDADTRAPGGAVTVALCGHWDHDPPCPLAPHHTNAQRVGDEVHVRILFATEPDKEAIVRQRIQQALSGGELDGTRWQLRDSQRSDIQPDETDHAGNLVNS